MKIFDFADSILKIQYEHHLGSSFESFLYIKCKFVDTSEYLEISKCNISARTDDDLEEHHHSFDNEWKMEKKTKYEIENIKKRFNLDPSGSKYMIFHIANMTIEPQNYTQICTLKQTKINTNENDFTCVNISPHVDSTTTNLTITPINQDILDENISKTNKLWWILIILIVPVTIICAMYI
ncbi:hypothetical protein RF11_03098 [Thelohanellus kitauei]|uniref:Uncharacterized protein n=1 Tax=Thelohanellus kitauei TaxID=669202 RepID=A0A0C2MC32_THEKT|nr:hypothetical protein RF11_03098 [Thelohanellus kitauei]